MSIREEVVEYFRYRQHGFSKDVPPGCAIITPGTCPKWWKCNEICALILWVRGFSYRGIGRVMKTGNRTAKRRVLRGIQMVERELSIEIEVDK